MNRLERWVLSETRNKQPWTTLALLGGAALGLVATADWTLNATRDGALVGLLVGVTLASLQARLLRQVIDRQSEQLERFGASSVPKAIVPTRRRIIGSLCLAVGVAVAIAVLRWSRVF